MNEMMKQFGPDSDATELTFMTPLQDLILVYIQSKTWFSVFVQREFLGHV